MSELLYIEVLQTKIDDINKKLQIAVEALEKVEDNRKIDHIEPDNYTKLGCLANIASVALEKIK